MHKLLCKISLKELGYLLVRQVANLFPDGEKLSVTELLPSLSIAQSRLEHCFSSINNKYYFNGYSALFDHLHGDQYASWLYFVSNQLYRDGAPQPLCKKIFLLNKMMHGCDIFYEIELPSIFLLVHPLGTVLGRGIYQDYLLVYQRCGIGSNKDVYPRLGRHVTLRPGSSVLGDSQIDDNVTIAAESLVIDQAIPSNTVYFGSPRKNWSRSMTNKENIWRN